MKNPDLLYVHPSECAALPWHNRADLRLTPEFLADINANGVRQTLLVRPNLAKDQPAPAYEIIAGMRRWSAAMTLLLERIPVRVEELTDAQAREARLAENLQREDLSALDEARQYQDALDSGDYGTGTKAVELLAQSVGKSRSHLYARLRLLTLSEPLRRALAAGEIEASAAELIATVREPKAQAELIEELAGHTEFDDERGKRVKAPMPFRQVKRLIAARFRQPLEDAPFDLGADGLADQPSCHACPLRTGNMEGLPAGTAADICTAPACYERKVGAHQAALLAELKAQGKAVLTGKDAPKWQYNSPAYNSGYVDATGTHWVKDRQVPYAKLLGPHMPTVFHAVSPKGKVWTLCREKEMQAALVAAKVIKPRREAKEPTPAAKARKALEVQVAIQTANALVGRLMDHSDAFTGKSASAVLLWLLEKLDNVDLINHEVILRRRGWAATGHFLDHARKLTHKELYALLLEGFLADDPYANRYDDTAIEQLAKAAGVKLDRAATEKTVRARLTAEAEAAAKAAAETKPAPGAKTKPANKSGKASKSRK